MEESEKKEEKGEEERIPRVLYCCDEVKIVVGEDTLKKVFEGVVFAEAESIISGKGETVVFAGDVRVLLSNSSIDSIVKLLRALADVGRVKKGRVFVSLDKENPAVLVVGDGDREIVGGEKVFGVVYGRVLEEPYTPEPPLREYLSVKTAEWSRVVRALLRNGGRLSQFLEVEAPEGLDSLARALEEAGGVTLNRVITAVERAVPGGSRVYFFEAKKTWLVYLIWIKYGVEGLKRIWGLIKNKHKRGLIHLAYSIPEITSSIDEGLYRELRRVIGEVERGNKEEAEKIIGKLEADLDSQTKGKLETLLAFLLRKKAEENIEVLSSAPDFVFPLILQEEEGVNHILIRVWKDKAEGMAYPLLLSADAGVEGGKYREAVCRVLDSLREELEKRERSIEEWKKRVLEEGGRKVFFLVSVPDLSLREFEGEFRWGILESKGVPVAVLGDVEKEAPRVGGLENIVGFLLEAVREMSDEERENLRKLLDQYFNLEFWLRGLRRLKPESFLRLDRYLKGRLRKEKDRFDLWVPYCSVKEKERCWRVISTYLTVLFLLALEAELSRYIIDHPKIGGSGSPIVYPSADLILTNSYSLCDECSIAEETIASALKRIREVAENLDGELGTSLTEFVLEPPEGANTSKLREMINKATVRELEDWVKRIGDLLQSTQRLREKVKCGETQEG